MDDIKLIDAKAEEEFLSATQWNERYAKERDLE
jgi:hypothetical protein